MSYERSEFRAKRVTSEASQLGVWGALSPLDIFFEFRTPESESERNLTNYFIIFLLTFLLRIFWKIFVMIIDLISFRYLKIIMKQSTIFVNPIHKK